MLGRIDVDTSAVRSALVGERLELLVRSAARRRVRLAGTDVKSLVEATTVAVLVRSIVDGVAGCATATRADRDSIRWAVQQARALRVAGCTSLRAAAEPTSLIPAEDGWAALDTLLAVDARGSVSRLRELDAAARHHGVDRTNTTWDHVAEVVTVANSAGLDLTYAYPEVTFALTVSIGDSDRRGVGVAGRTACHPSAIEVDALVPEAVDEASRAAAGRRRGRGRPSAMVIAPRAWSKLLAQLAAVFYGDRPDLTRSGLRVVGERVAAAGVSIVDDATDGSVLAVAPCDDEGTASQCTVVVADGQVRGLLHDLASPDYEAGESSTGNGWVVPAGAGVGFGVAVSGSVLRLDGPSMPLENLLASADPLLYVTRIDDGSGRGVDAVQDAVRLTVSGWLVRGGEPAEPIAAATVSLGLAEFLRRIRATSDVRQYYRIAAGSTLRKGPGACGTHVLVEDVPITLREDR